MLTMADLPTQAAPRWSIRDHPGLFEGLRDEAVVALQGVLKHTLDKVDSWLFDCLRKAPNYTPMLEAANLLRARRGPFEQAYLAQLQQGFAVLQGRILPEPSVELELSLVEDDELEGMLASESMVAALQSAHSIDFDVLARRLAVMAGRASLKDAHNPMSAARLASALQSAYRTCPLADAMRTALFKTYERELIIALESLLPTLSGRLGAAGILPNLDRRPEPVAEVEDFGPPLPAAQVYQPENKPGVDVREVFNALRGLLQKRRPTAVVEPAPGGLELPDLRRPLEESELVAVLSLMQPTVPSSVLAALEDSGAALAELVKEDILQNVGNVGLTRELAALSQDHEDAIDLVGMLFGVLFEEREFGERPRLLLAQLVVPFVKAAVIDLRMFQFTTHPARLLLNALAESLEGNRGEGVHERALQKQVESIIQRLLNGFKLSITVFPKLEKEFREYLVRHKQRQELAERRAAELQSGQERLENARARADRELQTRLAGRTMPERMREFLHKYWTHHIAMVLLREGAEQVVWRHAVGIGDRLLVLLAAGPVSVRKTLTEMDDELQGVLQSSGVTGDAAREILAGLLACLLERFVRAKVEVELPAAAVPAAPAPVPPPVVAAAPVPVAPAVAAAAAKPDPGVIFSEDLELAAMRALKVGDWIELVGEDRKTRPLKLSWVSPISKNMVFVNRHGARVLVASPDELVQLRHKGRLLLHAQAQLFDHAIHRIRHRLEAELGAA